MKSPLCHVSPLRPTADHNGALETQAYQTILERRPAQIISRLKEICRWRSYRRPGKLAPSAHRAAIFPHRAAGKLQSHWISRLDQYGPWRQNGGIGSVGTGDSHAAD